MKLETFLEESGVNYVKHLHDTTYTAQGLAEAEHVSGYMVAKPVVVKGATGFAMCVISAPRHVNLQRVAAALHEHRVRLATESEMSELFPECELGAEPPIGALFGLKTIMDQQLKNDEFLVMQAGSHTNAVKVRRKDWEAVCSPMVADITGN